MDGHLSLIVNGAKVSVPDRGDTLLGVLRDDLRLTGAKDGCSPQGQCGCCTVLVDGSPRVACVTPARRVVGRQVTTIEGLGDERRSAWGNALCETGGSQCGFCTPGIVLRLEGLKQKDPEADRADAEQALLAHLCRCTGWQTISDAFELVGKSDEPHPVRLRAAARRASIEGHTPQVVSGATALGSAGFSADTAPPDALVAVAAADGGWAVGETLAEARANAGKVQGRRTTAPHSWPLEIPDGDWFATLRTTWVDPGFLETDASWCEPGGTPTSPLANGGAFGGKVGSPVSDVARELAGQLGRTVLVLASREDSIRWGAKRPPIAAGIRSDGSGILRAVKTPGLAELVGMANPDLVFEEVACDGPPTSVDLRAAGWAEVAMLMSALRGDPASVTAPSGSTATARVEEGPGRLRLKVSVECGDVIDETTLRSYCIGAAHMAWSWVTSEALTVDAAGEPLDLTLRSFGIVRAIDTPHIDATIIPSDGPAVNGSDAVFAAVAAAVWNHLGRPQDLPASRAQLT